MSKLIRIFENDDFIIDYDKENNRYRVTYFEYGHFKEDCWFDAYEDKEVDDRIKKIIDKLEELKISFKNRMSDNKTYLSAKNTEHFLNLLIKWVKELK